MIKTQACKKAINASKNIIHVTNNQGIILAVTKSMLQLAHIVQANPIRIFNKACPDIILANNRIDKLKALEI